MVPKKPRLVHDLESGDAEDNTLTVHCNLSERGLTSESAGRALKAFPHATSIDLSRNSLDHCPRLWFPRLAMLNLSMNQLVSLASVAYLSHLRMIDLSFNRLDDVEPLMFCNTLVSVDLQGNRLTSTKGIECLKCLERLDLSDNLIEQHDSVRSLSLNALLSTLHLQVPQVSVLDGKRQSRQHFRCLGGHDTTSYVHMYHAKKQFRSLQPNHGPRVSMSAATIPRQPPDLTSFHPRNLDSNHLDSDTNDDAATVADTLNRVSVKSPRLRASTSGHHNPVHAGYCPKSLRPVPSIPPSLKMEKHKRHIQKTHHQTTDMRGYVSLFERVAVSSGVTLADDKPTKKRGTPAPPPVATLAKSHQTMGKRKNVISPPKVKVQKTPPPSGLLARRQLHFDTRRPTTAAARTDDPIGLNASQIKVLGVIQGLIQHKRQTLASLHSSTLHS
ncbi:hypothetical protein, variant [Aphanomyces astaci]|uniref:Uncharacterized protein n=1 Tax=Aphanomyces astaci TaxID=112090 RepID=W4G780_APHAT|nr:hypothetical protein, variant [Aphanomyces astaci]ETV75126.1 hypothetical protein, variant [Aphanomyces astaci]|eukprot:XP_009835629.1 hypothetical protein, variant [Aphanomyces astaci]